MLWTVLHKINWHGDVRAVLDAVRAMVKEYLYDAFGNEQTEVAADTNPFRYSGEYFDAESGNIYLRNRYYDASTGRFISEDPIQDGTNWYVYCNGNPIMFIDPRGLKPYDKFSTRDEAALDFGRYIAEQSFEDEEEYASYIYEAKNPDGSVYYYYDTPRNDLPTHADREISFSISWSGKSPEAVTHTHGAYDVSNENTKDVFSDPSNVASGNSNMSDAYQSDTSGLDYYLISPIGNAKVYISGSGNYVGILLSDDMPIDPNYETHQILKYLVGLESLENIPNYDENHNYSASDALKALQ